jgi:hypothetical protein
MPEPVVTRNKPNMKRTKAARRAAVAAADSYESSEGDSVPLQSPIFMAAKGVQ